MYMKFYTFKIFTLVGMLMSSVGFAMEDDEPYGNTRTLASYSLPAVSPLRQEVSVCIDTSTGNIDHYRFVNGRHEYTVYLPLPDNLSLASVPPSYRSSVLKAAREGLIKPDDEKGIRAVFTLGVFREKVTRKNIKTCLRNFTENKEAVDKTLSISSVVEIILSHFREEKTKEQELFLPPCQIGQFTVSASFNSEGVMNYYKFIDSTGERQAFLYAPLPESLRLFFVDPHLMDSVLATITGIIDPKNEKAMQG